VKATERDLEQLGVLLNERGYLVISTLKPCKVGEILRGVQHAVEDPPQGGFYSGGREIESPLIVIRETDACDFLEQSRRLNFSSDFLRGGERFYRVTTD
jgi:hypothetical protein